MLTSSVSRLSVSCSPTMRLVWTFDPPGRLQCLSCGKGAEGHDSSQVPPCAPHLGRHHMSRLFPVQAQPTYIIHAQRIACRAIQCLTSPTHAAKRRCHNRHPKALLPPTVAIKRYSPGFPMGWSYQQEPLHGSGYLERTCNT